MKLKVCGMKYPDNITEVAKLLPDFMGFIFYPKSKRFVGDNFKVPEISSSIKKVGVFVNETIENMLTATKKYKLDYVQLHGNESAEVCKRIREKVRVIKAFGLDEKFDFDSLKEFERACEYFLFDSKTNEFGGSGNKFNWKILNEYKRETPFFLSGGIGLDEIASCKSQITNLKNLFAIDLNSKFEIEPGLKDIEKLKAASFKLRQ